MNKFKLMGPQPVTLRNIDDILQNYAVTEKADGDRYLLFIYNKKGYLINQLENIIDTGITFNNIDDICLLDGEYLQHSKLYMIFDIYLYNKKGVQIPIC